MLFTTLLSVVFAVLVIRYRADQLNVQFQAVGIDVSSRLVNLLPYVAVIVVLTAWGKTRMPSSVGEPYDTEE